MASQEAKAVSPLHRELDFQADTTDMMTPHLVKRMTRSQRLRRMAMVEDKLAIGVPTIAVRDAEEAFLRLFELQPGEAATYTYDTTTAKEAEKFVKRIEVYTNSNCMPYDHIVQVSRREVDDGIRAIVEVFPRATPRAQRHLQPELLGFWTDRGGKFPKPERHY